MEPQIPYQISSGYLLSIFLNLGDWIGYSTFPSYLEEDIILEHTFMFERVYMHIPQN